MAILEESDDGRRCEGGDGGGGMYMKRIHDKCSRWMQRVE